MSQNLIDYIYNSEWELFSYYKQFLPEVSPILKIGHGLGFSTKFIASYNQNVRSLDVEVDEDSLATEHALLYGGYPIPFDDSAIDTVVAIFTLHHIPYPEHFFIEMARVSARRIILVEETYDNWFQKAHLFLRDFFVHKIHGVENCKLYWNSYFSREEIRQLFKDNGMAIVHESSVRCRSYYKEVFVLELA